jgi:predicted O-linked N-acetylglucosamine transferase (SPINDLY family)
MAVIRRRLTRNCPLFDTDLFRGRIEAAYRGMWERWRAGKSPESFTVS